MKTVLNLIHSLIFLFFFCVLEKLSSKERGRKHNIDTTKLQATGNESILDGWEVSG